VTARGAKNEFARQCKSFVRFSLVISAVWATNEHVIIFVERSQPFGAKQIALWCNFLQIVHFLADTFDRHRNTSVCVLAIEKLAI